MKNIELKEINHYYRKEQVLHDVNISIKEGEFFTLLGPSGCGKTTILRIIGGFIKPISGSIYVGDKDITNLEPEHRNMGTVFQNYALFPNMTVEENVAYATCVTAKNMKADAIVCYTHTGDSARNLAGLGAACLILAITDNKKTFNQLSIVWNVTPVYIPAQETINKTIECGIEKLKNQEILEKGDLVIIAGGDQIMKDKESSINKTLGGVLKV